MSKTLSAAIREADELRPGNPFGNDRKTAWINALEGRIQTDVFLRDTVEIKSYDYDTDGETELLLKAPYDDLYLHYLLAMIDFSLGEYSEYENSMAMFNGLFGNFVRRFAAVYEPAKRGGEYTYLGALAYTDTSGNALELYTLPRGALMLNAACFVETGFNSGASDTLILGTEDRADALMAAGDIDAGAAGTYMKAVYLMGGKSGTKLFAVLTKTGTEATEGRALFYGRILTARL